MESSANKEGGNNQTNDEKNDLITTTPTPNPSQPDGSGGTAAQNNRIFEDYGSAYGSYGVDDDQFNDLLNDHDNECDWDFRKELPPKEEENINQDKQNKQSEVNQSEKYYEEDYYEESK